MTSLNRTIPVQYGATAQPKDVRADPDVVNLAKNLTSRGITNRDVDTLIRSPQLTGVAANGISDAVIKPMAAAARNRSKKISINGKPIKFASAASADYFVSQLGKFFAGKTAGDASLPAKKQATGPQVTDRQFEGMDARDRAALFRNPDEHGCALDAVDLDATALVGPDAMKQIFEALWEGAMSGNPAGDQAYLARALEYLSGPPVSVETLTSGDAVLGHVLRGQPDGGEFKWSAYADSQGKLFAFQPFVRKN